MAKPISLSQLVKVRGRFYRSVQINLDWAERISVKEYIPTPTAKNLAIQISEGAFTSAGPKAWSILGPFGTGKSAFSLFLVDLFCNKAPLHPQGQIFRAQYFKTKDPFIPILLSGNRTKLNKDLLIALSASISKLNIELSTKALRLCEAIETTDRDVIDLINEINDFAKSAGFGGLLIVIDEFGKYLEYAAQNPENEDVFTLQHLAELAERSNPPIILVTVLHTAFSEYLHSLDRTQQLEWQKVQGRFTNVPFLEPYEQIILLIGSALDSNFSSDVRQEIRQLIDQMLSDECLNEAKKRIHLEELLPPCAPLHPITTLILPSLFRGKLAQNERSLFAFLTSREPFSFQEFLDHSELSDSKLPFYGVDVLYDYVINSLGSSVFIGDRSHRWAGIESALQRIPAHWPPLTSRIVKVIGILGLYGTQVGLFPSKNLLNLILGDHEGVEKALSSLVSASIVVFRKHENAYGLWEGSDVNLDEAYELAKTHISSGNVSSRLKELVNIRPIVARGHYIRTGTLRYFNVDVVDGTEANLNHILSRGGVSTIGTITYVLMDNNQERKSLMDYTNKLTSEANPLDIFAFPRPLAGLEKSIQEVEIWKWISDNTKALQGDPVARQEVRSQMILAKGRLTQIAGQILHITGCQFTPQASEWVQGGKKHVVENDSQFQHWLSALLDSAYSLCPVLKNELINRDELSSSAAAARRNLISAMLDHENDHDLAFTGNPAEYSIYLAMLKVGGFHQLVNGTYRFTIPGPDWKPVWNRIDEFLIASLGKRQPINKLFEILRNQPFGVKLGPLPVILCAFLLAKRNQIALYEDGVFVPDLRIEVFERLVRVPDTFEIQLYESDQKASDTLTGLSSVLNSLNIPNTADSDIEVSLLKVIKPLVIFIAKLPVFSKKTRHIDADSIAVREALLRARDPYFVIYESLPSIFKIPLDSPENIQRFFESLSKCLGVLQRAYPRLLDELEQQLRTALGLAGPSETARRELCLRAKPLEKFVVDRTLGLFVREAARLDSDDRDWREIIGRAVNQGIPTDQWTDLNLLEFQVRVMQISADFIRLEELVAEQKGQGNAKILRIGILDKGLEQERTIISVREDQEAEINSLAVEVAEFLSEKSGVDWSGIGNNRQLHLAVLSKLVVDLLQHQQANVE